MSDQPIHLVRISYSPPCLRLPCLVDLVIGRPAIMPCLHQLALPMPSPWPACLPSVGQPMACQPSLSQTSSLIWPIGTLKSPITGRHAWPVRLAFVIGPSSVRHRLVVAFRPIVPWLAFFRPCFFFRTAFSGLSALSLAFPSDCALHWLSASCHRPSLAFLPALPCLPIQTLPCLCLHFFFFFGLACLALLALVQMARLPLRLTYAHALPCPDMPAFTLRQSLTCPSASDFMLLACLV